MEEHNESITAEKGSGFDLHNSKCLKFELYFFSLHSENIKMVHKLQSDVASELMSPHLCLR